VVVVVVVVGVVGVVVSDSLINGKCRLSYWCSMAAIIDCLPLSDNDKIKVTLQVVLLLLLLLLYFYYLCNTP